ncbi:unnamed protein product, partial [Allacma fusca]
PFKIVNQINPLTYLCTPTQQSAHIPKFQEFHVRNLKPYYLRESRRNNSESSDSDSEEYFPKKPSRCENNIVPAISSGSPADPIESPFSADYSDTFSKMFETTINPFQNPDLPAPTPQIPKSNLLTPRRSSRTPRPPKRLMFNVQLNNVSISTPQMSVPGFGDHRFDLNSPVLSPVTSDDEETMLTSEPSSPGPITTALAKM